jgi:hypothetical protein
MSHVPQDPLAKLLELIAGGGRGDEANESGNYVPGTATVGTACFVLRSGVHPYVQAAAIGIAITYVLW